MNTPPLPSTPRARPVADASLRAFHAYAAWLVSISWWRFWLLAILGFVAIGILTELPPFTWEFRHQVEETTTPRVRQDAPPPPASGAAQRGVTITIGDDGVRIAAPPRGTPDAASAPEAAGSAASTAITVTLPPGVSEGAVREALDEARRDIEAAIHDAAEAAREAEADSEASRMRERVTRYSIADGVRQLVIVFIIASAILKLAYKGRIQAEAKAAAATETAEAEALRRQLAEARMAAMQAQVEPHFLFNTLASIDHLIEVDPPRASRMQKNLIALLRASMPTLREAGGQGGGPGGVRDLGREIAVIRPYLEILKMRMEERLQTEIAVPDGLLSAEFPPLMLQTLVENAIRHGLEPKPEGGRLEVRAEVVHGRLAVTVADSGVGFGRAATAGSGVGLANVRERLAMLYGGQAALAITETRGGGTTATITVPYRSVEGAAAAA